MAEGMGEDEVARLLNENLAQEQNALRRIQTIGKRLAQQESNRRVRHPVSPGP
jgi:ferritin-like metal-binding protein YciE